MSTVIASLFIVAIYGVAKTILDILRGIDSETWPETECIITEAYFNKKHPPGYGYYYIPVIKYKYTYDAHLYEGQRLRFAPSRHYYTEKEMDSFLAKYKKGQKHELSVNPKNPKVSVLRTGVAQFN